MLYPNRKLHRLKSWDYSNPGYYHVTLCTHDKKCLLSKIHQTGPEACVQLTEVGKMVQDCLLRMNTLSAHISTDYFCIMPNHIHCIFVIKEKCEYSISGLVQGFKSVTTRTYRKMQPELRNAVLWQSSFYDEIIRNEEMLYYVRRYIEGNPSKWLEDTEYMPS